MQKIPEPRGRDVSIYSFVDDNHAGNVVTMRLHTGIIVFIQNTPIIWFSKIHNMVEASKIGSELVALRIFEGLIVALRYKLRILGVRIEVPAYFSVIIMYL